MERGREQDTGREVMAKLEITRLDCIGAKAGTG
jgi:hypothetical protein